LRLQLRCDLVLINPIDVIDAILRVWRLLLQVLSRSLAEQLQDFFTDAELQSQATAMGYSRDSFYRFKELYETGGEAVLQEIERSKANLRNRIGEKIEKVVVEMAIEDDHARSRSTGKRDRSASRYIVKTSLSP